MDLEVLNLKADASSVDKATTSVEELEKKLSRTERTVAKAEEALKILRGELVQVGNRAISLGDGFTKSQANMLAMLKQAGATTAELKAMAKTMEQLNKITSTNPFDKSVQALNFVKKQREELTKSIKYSERYNDLTKEQVSLMTRGIESVRQRAASEQKSFGEREAAVKKFIREFVKEAQSYNQVTAAIEDKNRVAKEDLRLQQEQARASQISAKQRADAERYVQETLQRTLFINEQLEKGMSVSGANSLYSYKQQLDILGLSADQASVKMQAFQNVITQNQTLRSDRSPFKKMSEDIQETNRQVNHLARAVSVQLGDVFVSLASGQNPLIVAIQQGDQIRGALEQAKAAGQSLDNVMKGAFASMANSFVLVGSIVKDFLIDGIMSAGRLVTNFNTSVLDAIGRMVGLGNAATNTIKAFEDGAAAGNKFSAAMVGVMNVSRILAGGLLLGIVAAIGTFAVASVKLSNDLDKLAVALNMSGASLGLTAQQAQQAAEKISDSYGTNIYDALDAVTLFATKNIQFTDEMIVSATELSRVTGKSLSDIIESYSSLKGKPVEGLLDVAIATGQVNIETIKAIDKLVEQGKVAEATKLAMQEKARAEQEAARNTLAEMTPLGRLWVQMKKDVSELGDAVYDLVTKSVLVDVFAVAWKGVASVFHVIAWAVQGAGKMIGGIAAQLVALANLDFSGVMSIGKNMMDDAAAGYRNLEGTLSSLWKTNDELARKELEAAAARRQASSDAASQYKKEYETRKKGADEAGKEAEKTQKYFEKLMEGASDLALKTQQEVSKLNSGYEQMTNSQKMLFDAQNDPRWESLSARQKLEFENALKLIEANEELIRQYNAQVALHELLSKWADDYDSAALSIKEEAAALELRNNLLFKTEEEAKAIQRQYDLNVKLAAVENKYIERRNRMMMDYVKLVQDGNWSPEALEEYRRNMAAAAQQEAIERELAHKDANLKIVEDYEKKFREVQETITDIVATALFEGGKAGSKKLKDVLKTAFRNFVIDVFINPIIGNTMGAISQSLGIGANAQGGTLGNIGSLLGSASNLQSLYGAVTGGITSTIGSAVGAVGTAIGSSAVTAFAAGMKGSTLAAGLAGPTTAGASGAMGLGASFGAALPWVAGAFAVANLLGAFDKKPSDKTSAATMDLTSGAVTSVWDMGGKKAASQEQKDANKMLSQVVGGFAKLAGITGELVTAMGSRDGIRVAITGGFKTPEGAAGGGTWLGGKETIYSFGSDMETAIVAMLNDLVDEGTLSDSTIKSWRSLKDITETSGEMIESLNALVAGLNEETIRFAYSIKDSSVSLMDTLFKLTSQLNSVNAVFQMLGYNLIDTNTAGYKAADSLVRLFGSIEAMNSATSIYYENFYTEEEKITLQTKQLTEAFKLLGFSLPKTREEYRKLVEMQDLNSEYGRVMYVSLINLSGAFNQIIPAIDTLEGRLGTLIGTLVGDTLSEIDKQIQSSSDAAIKARESSKAYREVGEVLVSTAKKLVFGVSQFTQQSYKEALSLAQGGNIDAMKSLPGLAEAFTSQRRSSASTSVEAARSTARIANELMAVSKMAEVVADTADYQAMLYDINVALLEVVKEQLESENINITLLKESIAAIDNVGKLIQYSSNTQISAIKDNAGNTVTALVDGNKSVIKTYDSNTALYLQAIKDQIKNDSLLAGGVSSAVVKAVDYNGDGFITSLELNSAKTINSYSSAISSLAAVFETQEKLTAESITKALSGKASASDITALISAVDRNKDGIITKSEFLSAQEIAALDKSTIDTVSAMIGGDEQLGLAFTNSITGQTTKFEGFSESQIKEISYVQDLQEITAELTGVVADITGYNANLSEGILSRLNAPEAGFQMLSSVISAGNSGIMSGLNNIVFAITSQIAAQQAEIKKQQDVVKAQKELEAKANYYKTLEDARIAAEKKLASTPQTIKREGILSFLPYLQADNSLLQAQSAGENFRWANDYNSLLQAQSAGENPEYANAYNSLLQAQSAAASYAEELENQRQVIRNLGAVPAFATGGVFTNGVVSVPTTFNMGLMGEAGPEAIMPLTNVGGSLGVRAEMPSNDELVAEVHMLRMEMSELKASSVATARNTHLTRKQLERWDGDGMPETRDMLGETDVVL